ncbi:MAG: hypothetical protein ABFD14_05010 [Anaerolineaceae bacterium]
MEKKNTLTKMLAIMGTLLVWFPLLAAVILSIAHLIRSGKFLFDFLIPAEIFYVILIGGALLIWAAVRAKTYWAWIIWSLVGAVVCLVASQGLAMVTGIASGTRPAEGFWWIMVMVLMGLVIVAEIIEGIGGILLTRKLFTPDPKS